MRLSPTPAHLNRTPAPVFIFVALRYDAKVSSAMPYVLRLSLVAVFCGSLATNSARAEVGVGGDSSSSSKLRAAGERRIAKPRRAETTKAPARSENRRTAVNLKIPVRLQAALARKIEARIARNVGRSKQLRREAMILLGKFVAEADASSAEMPEALLRLGELEWEEARDGFVQAFAAWEKLPAHARGEPPRPEYAKPRERIRQVLIRYKSFGDYDLALYVDGSLANEEGKLEEARARFDKIIEWFPKSRFVPDAHMARAEYEFSKTNPDYEAAYREYEQVLRHRTSDLYDLALFKSAWTLWRLGKSEEAATRFLSVFKATATDKPGSAKSLQELDELRSEALKNLVLVFVEDEKNRAEDMHRFLVSAGGDAFAARIVEALAEAFYDQAHYERGVEAYRLLLKLEPTSPNAYQHALRIAQAHSTMEAYDALRADYRWILADYVPPRANAKTRRTSAWLAAQAPAVTAAAETAAERQLREDALGLHAKAQADETSRAEFEAAVALYETYLGRFAERQEAYEIHYNVGDIQFYRLGDASAAADAYLACVRMNPSAALSRTALFNALAALETTRAAELQLARKSGKAREETATDKKLTQAMELYVKSYPTDARIPELLFRQGKLYYDHEVYDAAVRQWGLLVEKYPRSKHSLDAGELILDSFNKSRDYANIETWARRLKSAPAFQGSAQQARLDGLIVGAVFKQGERLAAESQHAAAARAYLRAAREFPRDDRAARAAVNAEVSAKRAGDLATLASAADLLVRVHAKRPEAAQGVWIAATTYQEVGLFAEAASYHAHVAQNWPAFEHHKAAAFNAVLLQTTLGNHEKAIESGQRFKKHYPRDEATEEVTFLMGKAHEKAGKKRDAALLYDRYAKATKSPSSQIEALVRLAAVSEDERARAAALDRAVHVHTNRKSSLDERGRYYAARARYMQGEVYLARFDAVRIEGEVRQLKERLRKKSELLKKAADAFLATAELGVAEWTTAALYQIGHTYESFSRSLLESPPPASLSEADKETYRQSIEEFVIPIEERSLEAYESGWQKAVELDIYNSWTARMREALGRLNAELYPPLKEIGFELRSQRPLPLPALIEAPRRDKQGRSQPYLVSTAVDEPPEPTGTREARP